MLQASLTHHAQDRSAARAIPVGVIDLILAYGESRSARDGARKHAFSGESLRRIRRDYGCEVAKALAAFRSAYVVEIDGKTITAAFARNPLFA